MRHSHFAVALAGDRLDGRDRVTLTIAVDEHGRGSATVRPLHSRRRYQLDLAAAVRCIAWRAAKEDVAHAGIAVPRPRAKRRV